MLIRVIILVAGCLLWLTSPAMGQRAIYGHSKMNGVVRLPDEKVTPGAVRTTDQREICAKGFRTAPYRRTTTATKNKVYAEYGVERDKGVCKGGCEVDHRVPLELGGEDVIENLWPQPSQPIPGFHQKDILENYLKHAVCIDKTMTLKEAQKALLGDWYMAYMRMPAEKR